jgi:hypothetical protein
LVQPPAALHWQLYYWQCNKKVPRNDSSGREAFARLVLRQLRSGQTPQQPKELRQNPTTRSKSQEAIRRRSSTS